MIQYVSRNAGQPYGIGDKSVPTPAYAPLIEYSDAANNIASLRGLS